MNKERAMPESAGFPLNAWYAAGWRGDFSAALTARTICDIPIVFFRRRDGGVSALEDVCRHRLLPLSMGRLDNDRVICGYHGMTFSAAGECLKLPGAPDVTPSKANFVRTFPVVERYGLVWIWPGDPSKVNDAEIPDFHWADDPAWAYAPCYLHMACDFRLVLDNLMDLTHESYVHTGSIGQSELTEAPFEVAAEGGHVWLKRFMFDMVAPPFLAAQLKRARGLPPEHVDRWQIIHFEAPSTIVIDVGVAPHNTGAAEGDYSQGVNTQVLNAVTPGRAGEAHYFFALARNFLVDDAELTKNMGARNVEIFLEDKAILEGQYQNMARLPERKLLNLGIDKGVMRARQAIAHLIARESGGPLVQHNDEHVA